MPRIRRVLAIAALCFTVPVAATAQAADPYPVGSPVWNAALEAGEAHWGSQPCGGMVGYAWAPLPEGVVGYAAWTRSSLTPLDTSRFSACRIDLNPDMDLGPELFCTALAHELGHLHGHEHADDPGDLMAESIGEPIAECVAAMAPFQPQTAPQVAVAAATPAAAPVRHRHAKPKRGAQRRRHARAHRHARRSSTRP